MFWVFFESDGKIEINNKKNWAGNFFFEKFETFFYLGKVFFFLVTTFKFGLFSSFFIGSAAKTTNSILNFFSIFFFCVIADLVFFDPEVVLGSKKCDVIFLREGGERLAAQFRAFFGRENGDNFFFHFLAVGIVGFCRITISR